MYCFCCMQLAIAVLPKMSLLVFVVIALREARSLTNKFIGCVTEDHKQESQTTLMLGRLACRILRK